MYEGNDLQFRLLFCKSVYPYGYIALIGRFDKTKILQNEVFYSRINLGGINKEDYEYSVNVWKMFVLIDLGDYHDLYLKTDVHY